MVLDCRVTNALCAEPPHSFLTTPISWVRLRINFEESVGKANVDVDDTVRRPYEGRISVLDLVDSFLTAV